MAESEVAQLMRRIGEEYQAAQNGLTGIASGTARHAFITARLENIQRCHEQISTLLGDEEAAKVLSETFERL